MGIIILIGIAVIIVILIKVVRDLKSLDKYHQDRPEEIKEIIKEAGEDDDKP